MAFIVGFISAYKDEISAVSAAFLAFITFALAFIAYHQYKTTQRQLRAYVFVDDGFAKLNTDGTYQVLIWLKNSGQTPAYRYSTWIGGEILPFKNTTFTKSTPLKDRKGESAVGPGSMTQIAPAPVRLIGDELDEIRAERKAIFVWGGADYTDAFKKRRYLIFRMRMAGPEIVTPDGRRGWPLKPHPLGYEAN
jgi:hypothetical protein